MNFTWKALESAQTALNKLRSAVSQADKQSTKLISKKDGQALRKYNNQFIKAISDDFNMPEALAVVWEVAKSKISNTQKLGLIKDWDQVLGLDLTKSKPEKIEQVPKEVEQLAKQREELRKQEKWDKADEVRKKIEEAGYSIEDTSQDSKLSRARA
jgi:cysteinyl-tRNA synthetase